MNSASSMRVRRPRLRRAVVISAAVFGVLLVTGEFVARTVVGNKLTHAVRSALGGQVTVGIGTQPALIDAMTQSIPKLSIHATQVTLCPLKNVAIDATLNDVHRHGSAFAVSGSHAQAVLAPQALAAMLAKAKPGTNVMVVPDAAAQVLQVHAGGGLLSIDERPELVGNTLRFTPIAASFGGLSLPAAGHGT